MRRVFATTVALSVLMAPLMVVGQTRGDVAKGDVGRGEEVFEERCASCHVRAGGGQGPSLVGVLGRKSASVPGAVYSKGLKASNLTWTPAELDRFLTQPMARVSGTAMPLAVPNAKDRADLIAFFASKDNKR